VLFKPRTLREVTHLIIAALLILSLSRPQIQRGVQEEPVDAKDILIALDVSYSMRAQDIKPDRYRYTVKVIDALLEKRPKDNIMLIAFTTNPLLLSPPTTDHTLVRTALKALNLDNILTKGTSLSHLFEKIASLKNVHREVVLMTDGGEEKNLEPLRDAIAKSDMQLTILALGTQQGTTIPKADGSMLKDKAGNLVISRINPLLKTLSHAVGGSYVSAADSPQESADAIIARFSDAGQNSVRKKHDTYTELYQLPLFVATLLFFMLHTRFSRYLLIVFALFGMELHASFFDALRLQNAYTHYQKQEYNSTRDALSNIKTPSLQQQFALGNTCYRLHRYKKAIAYYNNIRTTSPRIKQKLYYNIANAYTMLEAYDKAKIYYTKALQLGKDADAEHNLALVALLQNRHDAQLGIAHPKSQSGDSSKSDEPQDDTAKQNRQEDQPSSGSGSGGQTKQKSAQKQKEKQQLKLDESAQPQPLSSKVYELINKGYIREKQPW
jgi:Ca-activated chloride channel family protein